MICLRSTLWPVEIVGLGDRETGLCTVRIVGGPDHGKTYDGIHISDLDAGCESGKLHAAFYGTRKRQLKRPQNVDRARLRARRIA